MCNCAWLLLLHDGLVQICTQKYITSRQRGGANSPLPLKFTTGKLASFFLREFDYRVFPTVGGNWRFNLWSKSPTIARLGRWGITLIGAARIQPSLLEPDNISLNMLISAAKHIELVRQAHTHTPVILRSTLWGSGYHPDFNVARFAPEVIKAVHGWDHIVWTQTETV